MSANNPRRNGFEALEAKYGHAFAVRKMRAVYAMRNGTATIGQTRNATRQDRHVEDAMRHYGISRASALELLKS